MCANRIRSLVLLLAAALWIASSLAAPEPFLNLTKLVDTIWELDGNRLEVGKDIVLDLQGPIRGRLRRADVSVRPLFTFVNETRLNATQTFRALTDLVPFYNPDVRVNESDSPAKTACQKRFVSVVMKTAVMQKAQRYLVDLGLTPAAPKAFAALLCQIWFTGFVRKKQMSSSAFEHVFLGEARGARVYGFHHWLRLYLEEKRGELEYLGHYPRPKKEATNVTHSISFKWGTNGSHQWFKEYDTFLFGTSPEFDLALYTAAYLTMDSRWPDGFRFAASLKTQNLKRIAVQCYRQAYVGRKIRAIGSCYIV